MWGCNTGSGGNRGLFLGQASSYKAIFVPSLRATACLPLPGGLTKAGEKRTNKSTMLKQRHRMDAFGVYMDFTGMY